MTTFKKRYSPKEPDKPPESEKELMTRWAQILPGVLKNLAKRGVLKYSQGYEQALAREFEEWKARNS